MTVTMRFAEKRDLDDIARCFADGMAYQKAQGFDQWTPDYPNRALAEEDIEAKKGFMFLADGKPAGYCCLDFDGEPAYDHIDGAWLQDGPYAVVHRMAFLSDARGKGLSKGAFHALKQYCLEKGVFSLRADTQDENKGVQHILAREGFVRCGTVTFQNGPKLAYEAELNSKKKA